MATLLLPVTYDPAPTWPKKLLLPFAPIPASVANATFVLPEASCNALAPKPILLLLLLPVALVAPKFLPAS